MHVADGFHDLTGGMSSGLKPSLISPNQAANLVNVTTRGGKTRNRYGYRPLKVNGQVVTVGDSAVVQGLEAYQPVDSSTPYFFALIGGRTYRIDLNGTVTDQTISGDPNSSTLPQAWMKQGDQYFFIQDGQSRPLIYDGSTWRRANFFAPPDWEMPVGTAMEYAFGRMCVARGREWVAGDINGGPTQIYQFTENSFLAEGGAFNVPIPGSITAMKVMAALDNAIGQGPLTIHTPNGICTARIDQPRLSWKDIQFQQVAARPSGALSQNSCVLVNGDLWFRAFDGWHSFILARRDFGAWGNVPQSFEMTEVLRYDDPKLLRYCAAHLFDGRLIGTSWPAPYKSSAFHKGLVSLDFKPLGSLAGQIQPDWEGVWTGINPTAMAKITVGNKERIFALSRNTGTNKNELWEVTTDQDFDSTDGRIIWSVDTRSFPFNTPAGPGDRKLKKLFSAEMFLEDVKGQVDFIIYFKPDQYPCWTEWMRFGVCNTVKDCGLIVDGCQVVRNLQPGFKPRLMLPQPPDICQQGSTRPMRMGYEFQARVEVTGHCIINKFALHAEDQEQIKYDVNVCPNENLTVPNAPSEVVVTPISDTEIDVSWVDDDSGASSFIVERRIDSVGDFEPVGTVTAGSPIFHDTGLDPGIEYCYRVKSTNIIGDSDYSDVVCGTTISFDPADYANWLGGWISDDVGLSGSDVTGMPDLSPNGKNLTNLTASKPTLVSTIFGTHPAVRFGTTDKELITTTGLLAGNNYTKSWTIAMVIRRITEPSLAAYTAQLAFTGDYAFGLSVSESGHTNRISAFAKKFGSTPDLAVDTVVSVDGEKSVIVATWDGVNIKLWRNGTLRATTAISATTISAGNTSQPICVGGRMDGTLGVAVNPANIDLAMEQVWNSVLSDVEIAGVFTKLNAIYAIY